MKEKEPYDDKQMLKQLKKGKIEAFEKVYNYYRSRLYLFIIKHINSPEESEEMLQNTFLALWENRHTMDENKSLRNFILTIAINKVYNFYKQKAVRGKHREIIAATTKHEQDSLYQELYYNELQKNLEIVTKTSRAGNLCGYICSPQANW